MTERTQFGSLKIASVLYDLIENEIAPGTGVKSKAFWKAFEAIINDLAPVNRQLLTKRDELQARIDAWHNDHQPHDPITYKQFLKRYWLPAARSA